MRFELFNLSLVVFLSFLLSSISIAASSYSRVQELFIWKVAEELQLDSEVNEKFALVIREVGEEKRRISLEMNLLLNKMKTSKGQKLEKELHRYETLLGAYSDAQKTEFKKLKELLGTQKLAKYYILKDTITKSLKRRLASPKSKKD